MHSVSTSTLSIHKLLQFFVLFQATMHYRYLTMHDGNWMILVNNIFALSRLDNSYLIYKMLQHAIGIYEILAAAFVSTLNFYW